MLTARKVRSDKGVPRGPYGSRTGNPKPPMGKTSERTQRREQLLQQTREEFTPPARDVLAARAALLTPCERTVMMLVAEGCNNRDVGLRLSMSPWTVADHLKAVFGKLRVHDRTHAVVTLMRAGALR